jgi:hypothetical protein
MTEWQVLGDTIDVRLVHLLGRAKGTAALGAFGREQMAFASSRTHDFAAGRDFKSLGHCLACFGTFGASHIFSSLKRARNIGVSLGGCKCYFDAFCALDSSSDSADQSIGDSGRGELSPIQNKTGGLFVEIPSRVTRSRFTFRRNRGWGVLQGEIR